MLILIEWNIPFAGYLKGKEKSAKAVSRKVTARMRFYSFL